MKFESHKQNRKYFSLNYRLNDLMVSFLRTNCSPKSGRDGEGEHVFETTVVCNANGFDRKRGSAEEL